MTAPAVSKPDPKLLYVCIEGHSGPTGAYREGDRQRGENPDVKRVPVFWVPDGTPTDEIFEARQARFYARLGAE